MRINNFNNQTARRSHTLAADLMDMLWRKRFKVVAATSRGLGGSVDWSLARRSVSPHALRRPGLCEGIRISGNIRRPYISVNAGLDTCTWFWRFCAINLVKMSPIISNLSKFYCNCLHCGFDWWQYYANRKLIADLYFMQLFYINFLWRTQAAYIMSTVPRDPDLGLVVTI